MFTVPCQPKRAAKPPSDAKELYEQLQNLKKQVTLFLCFSFFLVFSLSLTPLFLLSSPSPSFPSLSLIPFLFLVFFFISRACCVNNLSDLCQIEAESKIKIALKTKHLQLGKLLKRQQASEASLHKHAAANPGALPPQPASLSRPVACPELEASPELLELRARNVRLKQQLASLEASDCAQQKNVLSLSEPAIRSGAAALSTQLQALLECEAIENSQFTAERQRWASAESDLVAQHHMLSASTALHTAQLADCQVRVQRCRDALAALENWT